MTSLAPWVREHPTGLAGGTRPAPQSAIDTVKDTVWYRSPLIGAGRMIANRSWAIRDPDEPDFDPFAAPLPPRLEPYRYRFGMTASQREFDRLQGQIDAEVAALGRAARSPGGVTFMAETLAAFLDPVVLVPPAKAASFGKALRANALRYGAAETAMQSVQLGTGRQQVDETAVNIALASTLGSIIGGWAGRNQALRAELHQKLEDLDRAIDRDIGLAGAVDGLDPAAARQPTWSERPGNQGPVAFDVDGAVVSEGRVGDVADLIGIDSRAYARMSAGDKARAHRAWAEANPDRQDELFAALGVDDMLDLKDPNVGRLMGDLELAPAFGLERLGVGPLMRLSKASVGIPQIQETIQGLVPLEGMFTRGSLKGRATAASAYARAHMWRGKAVEVRNTIDRLFLEDRGVDPGGFAPQMKLWWSDGFQGVPSGKLDRHSWNREVSKALLAHGEHPNPRIKTAAAEVRKLLDELGDEGLATGVLARKIAEEAQEGYLPRIWRVDQIEARKGEFIERLARWWSQAGKDGGPPMVIDEARRVAAEVTEDIISRWDPFHRFDPDVTGQATSAYQRKVDAPSSIFINEELGDFVEMEIEGILQHYARAMGTDIELARRFGSVSMAEHLAGLKDTWLKGKTEPVRRAAYEAARGAGDDHNAAMSKGNRAVSAYRVTKEYAAQLKEIDGYIDDLRATRDRIRGTYGIPEDPFRPQSKMIRISKQFNAMAYLGLSVTSALVDVARPLMVEGVERTWKHSLRPLMRGVSKETLAMSAKELRLAGTALDLVLSQRALAFADLGDVYAMRSAFERTMTDATNRFFQLTGLNHWTTFMKEWSGMIVMSRIKDTLDDLAAGTIRNEDRAALARIGLSEDLGRRVHAELLEHGEQSTTAAGGKLEDAIFLPNSERWTDREAVSAFRAALFEEVNRTIITPGIGERPHFISSELGSVIGQFKSFGLASQSRVLIGGLQDPDRTRFLQGVALLVAAGMMADTVRDRVRGRKRERDLKERIIRGVDRSGLLGWFADLNNAIESVSHNTVGLKPLLGEGKSGENSWQWQLGVLGPTGGTLANLITAGLYLGGGGGPMSYDQAASFRKLVPGNNLWFAVRAFDELPKDLIMLNRFGGEDWVSAPPAREFPTRF